MINENKKKYNELSKSDKDIIVNSYYDNKELKFRDLSNYLNISDRALSRVLKEYGVNTKRINRYRVDEDFFKIIDSEEKAYILGLLYADGYVGNEHFNNIVLHLKDKKLVELVAETLGFTGTIRVSQKGGFENSGCGYVLNFSSTQMAEDLRSLGMYPNKSLTMTEIPNIKQDLLRHFIRGYFDGDGSIVLSRNTSYYRKNNFVKKYEYPTYLFALLGTESFLKNILSKLPVKHHKFTKTSTKEIVGLRIDAKCDFDNLFNYLYSQSTIYLERKYNKWLEIKSAFIK